jgi:hypothetical protein
VPSARNARPAAATETTSSISVRWLGGLSNISLSVDLLHGGARDVLGVAVGPRDRRVSVVAGPHSFAETAFLMPLETAGMASSTVSHERRPPDRSCVDVSNPASISPEHRATCEKTLIGRQAWIASLALELPACPL